MQNLGNTFDAAGTEDDSSANITAFSDQKLTILDLALMPDYRRNLHLRYMGSGAPTLKQIEAVWRQFIGMGDGHRIYFVQRGDGPIKIGLARNPKRRIAALQTACAERLIILATRPGDLRAEQEYHRQFAAYQMIGEWFSPAPAILQEVRRISAKAFV